ncbi:RNA-directed DNA polymerase, partial [Pyronema domesticum]
ITMLIQLAIHLGTNPQSWKIAQPVTILQPGKPTHSSVKRYRVISLLNYMGKVDGKMLSLCYEGDGGGLHNGQYG